MQPLLKGQGIMQLCGYTDYLDFSAQEICLFLLHLFISKAIALAYQIFPEENVPLTSAPGLALLLPLTDKKGFFLSI